MFCVPALLPVPLVKQGQSGGGLGVRSGFARPLPSTRGQWPNQKVGRITRLGQGLEPGQTPKLGQDWTLGQGQCRADLGQDGRLHPTPWRKEQEQEQEQGQGQGLGQVMRSSMMDSTAVIPTTM